MSGNTYQITPFMHVLDCDEAVRFFVDILGFTAVIDQGGYAYLSTGKVRACASWATRTSPMRSARHTDGTLITSMSAMLAWC